MEYLLCWVYGSTILLLYYYSRRKKVWFHLRIPYSFHLAPPYAFINLEMRAFCLTAQPTKLMVVGTLTKMPTKKKRNPRAHTKHFCFHHNEDLEPTDDGTSHYYTYRPRISNTILVQIGRWYANKCLLEHQMFPFILANAVEKCQLRCSIDSHSICVRPRGEWIFPPIQNGMDHMLAKQSILLHGACGCCLSTVQWSVLYERKRKATNNNLSNRIYICGGPNTMWST